MRNAKVQVEELVKKAQRRSRFGQIAFTQINSVLGEHKWRAVL